MCKVERSPPEREVGEFESPPSYKKDLKNSNRYKLESDIDKSSERWLYNSRQMLCERLLCPNGELNALGPRLQDPR